MKNLLKFGALTIIVISILCGSCRYVYHKSITYYPQFYTQLLEIKDEKLEQDAKDFVFASANLGNSILRKKDWSVSFTEDQINGWLERRVGRDLPGLIPIGAYYPRIHLEQDRIYFAMEFCPEDFESVVWTQIRPYISPSGSLNVVVEKARMGILPVSNAMIKNEIETRFKKVNVPFTLSENKDNQLEFIFDWRNIDSQNDWQTDPLIYRNRKITIDQVEILPGELKVSGSAKDIVREEDD